MPASRNLICSICDDWINRKHLEPMKRLTLNTNSFVSAPKIHTNRNNSIYFLSIYLNNEKNHEKFWSHKLAQESFARNSIYHISPSFRSTPGDFQIYFRVAEPQNWHKHTCLQITFVETFFIPLPTFNLLLFPGSSPIFSSLSPRYRRKLSPAQNTSFFTQYSISELFKAVFFWSGSQSWICSVTELLK